MDQPTQELHLGMRRLPGEEPCASGRCAGGLTCRANEGLHAQIGCPRVNGGGSRRSVASTLGTVGDRRFSGLVPAESQQTTVGVRRPTQVPTRCLIGVCPQRRLAGS